MTGVVGRHFVEQIREDNERDFGPKAKRAVQALLDAGLDRPWMYVYELTQNALDAGARRTSWQVVGDALVFQHDGSEQLGEKHVRALCSLGGSTKGLAAVGFMGVGFKSVFSRFRVARISGFGWHFRFQVGEQRGALGQTFTEWFDTLRPHWDEDDLQPGPDFTTAFCLESPTEHQKHSLQDDLNRFASSEDSTPLAVLALRGLQQVTIDDQLWNLEARDGFVEVRSPNKPPLRWKVFRSSFRPNDDAMRRFLQVRREFDDQLDDNGERVEREVTALLPLDTDGLPAPPSHGGVYATLPTQVQVPFGFHLQADWLVNVDRQSLRDVEGDPWQEAILQQVPGLVSQFFGWLETESEAVRTRAYPALREPRADDGPLAAPLLALRDAFIRELGGKLVVPIHGAEERRFCTPEHALRLTGQFLEHFGKRRGWRPDLLFNLDVMDESALGGRATRFAHWLGWGRPFELRDLDWPARLQAWWNAIPEGDQIDALFALWDCVRDQSWHEATVVPTEDGGWKRARDTRWLNEAPPTEHEPSGRAVAAALDHLLPGPSERLPSRIRARVNQAPALRGYADSSETLGVSWLKQHHKEEKLAAAVVRVCQTEKARAGLFLVELLEWALSRNDRRQDLVPLVLTEKGPRVPTRALLANPVLEGGESRRALFQGIPALVEDYAAVGDPKVVALFLERLGVRGAATLVEKPEVFNRYQRDEVAAALGIEPSELGWANNTGYTVTDLTFPFDFAGVPLEALYDWLSREHSALRGKGRRKADYVYYSARPTTGRRPCTWIETLQSSAWVPCTDGQRRAPGDVLLAADLDFDEAPVAAVDVGLSKRLVEEGLQFGVAVPRLPVLRRLIRRGHDLSEAELTALLVEAQAHIAAGKATQEELLRALDGVQIRGAPLGRIVQRTGSGTRLRGDLGGWVIALSDLEPDLSTAIQELGLEIPLTTTGHQSLVFLSRVWSEQPKERIDDLRRHLAAAYRYVLDDMEADVELSQAWHVARSGAQLYGGRRWSAIGPELVVEDVQSPWVRRLISRKRTIIASGHLGDDSAQVHRVANALGVSLLSDEVHVEAGDSIVEPIFARRLLRLMTTLGALPDRKALGVSFRSEIWLTVGGARHEILSYVHDSELLVAGEPAAFGPEAAGQIVEHFQLSQQGASVPWLTVALISIESEDVFEGHLAILADTLGVIPTPLIGREGGAPTAGPSPSGESDEQKTKEAILDGADKTGTSTAPGATSEPNSHGDSTDPGTQSAGPETREGDSGHGSRGNSGNDSRNNGSGARSHGGSGLGSRTPPSSGDRPRGGRAADHFRILLISRQHSDGEPVSGDRVPRDDQAARRAVVEYERLRGRVAEVMEDNQPGYDILSTAPTGRRRRIEVKGVQGNFDEDASVVMTGRQGLDAIRNDDETTEFWLYVVDSTESDRPRVFPIPWVRDLSALRYGFYARGWVDAAEEPAVVVAGRLDELALSAMPPLDPGDLPDDWEDSDGGDD